MSYWNEWVVRQSRQTIGFVATGLVLLMAVLDYSAGNDISLAVFYVFPIALATWYVTPGLAHALSILSVVLWLAGDYAVGGGWVVSGSIVVLWNAIIRLGFYYLIVLMLTYIHALNTRLETKVTQRTMALNAEIAERKRLEHELLDISERERRRLGYDLHDGLCQHLAGTAIAIQVLREKLLRQGLPEATEAGKAVELVQEGIDLSHRLAKNLQPVELRAGGLMQALQEFASATGDLFKVTCRFECDSPVIVPDSVVADHLYRIAQEAVGNAIKHGRARNIVISLDINEEGTNLLVQDDGVGLPEPLPASEGMGLRIMAQRAKSIGALFDIRSAGHGTIIACLLPHAAPA
jgi:signal transduction histidine kinase